VLGRLLGERADEGLERGLGGCPADAGFEMAAHVEGVVLILGDLLRQVDIGVVPGEAWCGHANDGVVLADHLRGVADDRAVGVEVALPELVAKDNDGLGILAVDGVGWLDETPEGGGTPKYWKALELKKSAAMSSGRSEPVTVRDVHVGSQIDFRQVLESIGRKEMLRAVTVHF